MKKGSLAYLIISIFAIMTSWFVNHSIGWAIFHYIIGPLYVVYSLLTGVYADGGLMEIINSYF